LRQLLVVFSLDGKDCTLNVYQSQSMLASEEYKDYLFLPFNDLTNSAESYGGGRYVEVKIPTDTPGEIVIDFNKAYNPYCAYSEGYSCPIPPAANKLDVEIRAGVRFLD